MHVLKHSFVFSYAFANKCTRTTHLLTVKCVISLPLEFMKVSIGRPKKIFHPQILAINHNKLNNLANKSVCGSNPLVTTCYQICKTVPNKQPKTPVCLSKN